VRAHRMLLLHLGPLSLHQGSDRCSRISIQTCRTAGGDSRLTQRARGGSTAPDRAAPAARQPHGPQTLRAAAAATARGASTRAAPGRTHQRRRASARPQPYVCRPPLTQAVAAVPAGPPLSSPPRQLPCRSALPVLQTGVRAGAAADRIQIGSLAWRHRCRARARPPGRA
jgi:hypothetical protein